jgi:hypothetical protein
MLGLRLRRGLATAAKAKAVSRVRGTRDLLADDSQQHREVLDLLQRTVARYGFRSVTGGVWGAVMECGLTVGMRRSRRRCWNTRTCSRALWAMARISS